MKQTTSTPISERGAYFRTNADGSLVCSHRDLSVCPECATHPMVVEVFGAHFLAHNDEELAELKAIANNYA